MYISNEYFLPSISKKKKGYSEESGTAIYFKPSGLPENEQQ